METTLNNKFFDFEKAKVQTLSLDQLARTHKENDIYGKPLRGIYHYELLNQIIGMCNRTGRWSGSCRSNSEFSHVSRCNVRGSPVFKMGGPYERRKEGQL